MASRNSRSSRSAARSSRTPQSARAVRTAKAAQSGRIASQHEAGQFSSGGHHARSQSSGYKAAYTPGSQGRAANGAFSRQATTNQYSRSNPSYSRSSSKRMGRGKKIALGVLAAFIVAVVGVGTASALYINSINKEITTGDKSQEELAAIQDVLAPKTSFNEPFYLMLIGSDRRDDDPSAGARSDTNIVVRVDPTQNLVTMVSIPRDTKITIDGYGENKFNAAYNYGGVASTVREANQLLGVEISHYAEVNFDELIGLVDAVGGVDVTVDERIDDTDADGSTDNPNAQRIIIEAGEQHLNGEQALVFARSRAYVDGDFTRTANQRKLITALVNKVLALPVTELPGVIQSAAKCVTTDLSVTDIISLAQQFQEGGDLTVYAGMVPSTTGYVDGISYVFTDETSLKKMMKLVEAGEDPSGIVASADAYSSNSSSSNSSSGSSSGYYDSGGGSGGGYDSSYGSQSYGTGSSSGTSSSYDAGTASGGSVDSGGYADSGSSSNSGGYSDGTGGSASAGGQSSGTGETAYGAA